MQDRKYETNLRTIVNAVRKGQQNITIKASRAFMFRPILKVTGPVKTLTMDLTMTTGMKLRRNKIRIQEVTVRKGGGRRCKNVDQDQILVIEFIILITLAPVKEKIIMILELTFFFLFRQK